MEILTDVYLQMVKLPKKDLYTRTSFSLFLKKYRNETKKKKLCMKRDENASLPGSWCSFASENKTVLNVCYQIDE